MDQLVEEMDQSTTQPLKGKIKILKLEIDLGGFIYYEDTRSGGEGVERNSIAPLLEILCS